MLKRSGTTQSTVASGETAVTASPEQGQQGKNKKKRRITNQTNAIQLPLSPLVRVLCTRWSQLRSLLTQTSQSCVSGSHRPLLTYRAIYSWPGTLQEGKVLITIRL